MDNKDYLKHVVDALIDDNDELAQTHFQQYAVGRMKSILNPDGDLNGDLNAGKQNPAKKSES